MTDKFQPMAIVEMIDAKRAAIVARMANEPDMELERKRLLEGVIVGLVYVRILILDLATAKNRFSAMADDERS